jgi:glyoxylase I family protein
VAAGSSCSELAAKGVRTDELRVDAATEKRMAFLFDPDDLPLELYEV